ncbi:DUF3560 domain-containing protein [Microbacterium aurantiacum]|uniref:DUF3560 domain-containing protein n=1 Tax=Microbacterium aurantiacum TaxID=162393 RepID=UPI003446E0A1
MLTITHSHEAGTLIEGTAKGDGTAEILKRTGWRWGRSIATWFVPMSRDRMAKLHVIRRTVEALRTAGFEVAEPEIDDTPRAAAVVEEDRIVRQAERVEALEAKVDRKTADATAAWDRHMADVGRLPEGGEPIKVGHHSEGRHRAALTRADRSGRRGIEAHNEAERAADRATAAASTTASRYNPITVANRIEKFRTELRGYERRIVADVYDSERGYIPATDEQKQRRAEHYAPFIEQTRDQLTYWEKVRADQVTAGEATNYSRETINAGDAVKIRGQWRRVARANAKTVSVETGHSWTDRAPYAEIQDHKAATA